MELCEGCRQNIPDRRFLVCCYCDKHYDLECANVPEARFYNTMSPNRKKTWKCQACICRAPKKDNSNTPIRPTSPVLLDTFVTKRNKQKKTEAAPISHLNQTKDFDQSISEICDDTQVIPSDSREKQPLNLDMIGELLDTKLEQIKTSILADIRNTIQSEFNIAIKSLRHEVEYKTNELKNEQNTIKEDIKAIDIKIKSIEDQLNTLTNMKKIVLFGLPEPNNETECDLYECVSRIFYDTLDININPFVEEISRIGKRGKSRPLVIEIMNKRMVKYIMRNNKCFKGTGLAVDTFMEGKELKDRNILRQNLQLARKNGHHAVIKNNKLYVDGKETPIVEATQPSLINSDTEYNENMIPKKNEEVRKLSSAAPQPLQQRQEKKNGLATTTSHSQTFR